MGGPAIQRGNERTPHEPTNVVGHPATGPRPNGLIASVFVLESRTQNEDPLEQVSIG